MKKPLMLNLICNITQFSQRLFYIVYCRLYKIFHTCFIIQVLYAMYYNFVSYITGNKKKLEWKTHWQSPQCHAILKRKYLMSRSKSSLSWALINLIFAVGLLLDMNTCYVSVHFVHYSNIIWYSELLITLIVACNAFTATIFYVWSVFSKPLPISPVQQKLFGISDNDSGFEVKKSSSVVYESDERCMPFSYWQDSDYSMLSITPLNYSAQSWASSPSYGLDSTSSSWSYYRPSSPNNFTSTPKSKNTDNYVSKKLLSYSVDSSFERPIRNAKQLEEFLKAYEEEDKKFKSMSLEESMNNVSTLDNSPLSVLGKCRYQRACRLPNTETVENDSSETHYNESLHKLKISEKMLTCWSERLRQWICQTILVKLVNEIDYINNSLSQSGMPEFQIGTVNLFALHQLSVTNKLQHLQTLTAVLPYLDMHLNQEYLVQRLRSLAKGGCMSEFKWNSGGSYGDKQWCDDLPTDSAIIIHVLCCYLDAYLPPEPHFPEGRPFSSKYFKKTPEKLTTTKDLHYIYQSSLNPPHFKVVIGEDIYSLQKGRNNLFYALLVFFYYLKTKECAMLGRVNLGPSGLNILWVFE